jgi:hypothetical protein
MNRSKSRGEIFQIPEMGGSQLLFSNFVLTSSSPKSSESGERIDTGNSLSCFLSMYSTRNTSTLFRTKNDNLQKVFSVVILLATALHTENRRNGEPSQT